MMTLLKRLELAREGLMGRPVQLVEYGFDRRWRRVSSYRRGYDDALSILEDALERSKRELANATEDYASLRKDWETEVLEWQTLQTRIAKEIADIEEAIERLR